MKLVSTLFIIGGFILLVFAIIFHFALEGSTEYYFTVAAVVVFVIGIFFAALFVARKVDVDDLWRRVKVLNKKIECSNKLLKDYDENIKTCQ